MNGFQCTCVLLALTECYTLKELRLLGLQAMTGKTYSGGWACLVPVQMGLEGIHAHPNLLNGYNLTYDYFDHEAVPGIAVYKMVKKLHDERPYVMLVGPILSTVATATAEIIHFWNLTQLAFAASSPELSDRKRFPNFNRLSSPDSSMNPARYDFAKYFNWRKIATIHHATDFFTTVVRDFVEMADAENVSIITQQIFLHNPSSQIQNLKDKDVRIIFAFMYGEEARQLLCEAYKIGFYGPKIVWVFMGFLSFRFWATELDDIDCTEEQMNEVADGLFLIRYSDYKTVERGIANLTLSEFRASYVRHPNYKPSTASYDRSAHRCFDGIWAAALALNCTVQNLSETGHIKTLDQFEYTDSDITEILFDCIANTRYTGVVGDISLSLNDRNPDKTVSIERIQDGTQMLLGLHNRNKFTNYFKWIEGALRWSGGNVPRDSSYVIMKEITIPTHLYAPMCALSVTGILAAMFFLVFNIMYRKNRFVKMSSPNINSVMLSGCILCYMSVFFKTVEITNPATCTARTCFLTMGFTVTFGALFSKTWRVYRLFTNKKLERMTIKDGQLFVINGVLAVGVLLVLTVWQVVSPNEIRTILLMRDISTNEKGEEVQPFVRSCMSTHSSYFAWSLCVIEGALLTFGAFLAWETRKVNIPGLNDSRQIGACLYNVVILSAMGLTLSLVLVDNDITLYGAISVCLITGTTLTQTVVFVPKVYTVFSKSYVESVHVDTSGSRQTGGTGPSALGTVSKV